MDIVERLRDVFSGNALKDIADQTQMYIKERYEAADEIERLREALQRCADLSEKWSDSLVSQINLIARSALQQKESEK